MRERRRERQRESGEGGGVTRATSHRRTLRCNPRHIENLGQKAIPVPTYGHVSRYRDYHDTIRVLLLERMEIRAILVCEFPRIQRRKAVGGFSRSFESLGTFRYGKAKRRIFLVEGGMEGETTRTSDSNDGAYRGRLTCRPTNLRAFPLTPVAAGNRVSGFHLRQPIRSALRSITLSGLRRAGGRDRGAEDERTTKRCRVQGSSDEAGDKVLSSD